MKRKNSVPALLSLQPMVGQVDQTGQIVSERESGPPLVVDVVDIACDPHSHELTVTSRSNGNSVSVGYDPAYAAGFDLIFGDAGRN